MPAPPPVPARAAMNRPNMATGRYEPPYIRAVLELEAS
nr:MAG TPA: hypothetical protein [Caudoviricetes sp.]